MLVQHLRIKMKLNMLYFHVSLNQITSILLNLTVKVQYTFRNTYLKIFKMKYEQIYFLCRITIQT